MLKPVATIELVYIDETGSTSAVVLNVPASTSIATMDALSTDMASLIAPMTDCELIKVRYSFRSVYEANISDAGSTPLVVTGVFFLSTVSPFPLGILTIPGIKPSLLVHTGPTSEYGIDLTDSRVVAMLDELLSIGATNVFGDAITGIDASYRQSRV